MTRTDDTKKDGLDHPFLCPWMDRQIFCSCNICTSTVRGGRIPQGARTAVRLCPWMDGQKIAPCIFRTSHFHVGRQKIAPCIFRTSHFHVGRILQGARKAVRMFGDFAKEKLHQKRVCYCHAGFVYA
jgi:hypothetical protein